MVVCAAGICQTAQCMTVCVCASNSKSRLTRTRTCTRAHEPVDAHLQAYNLLQTRTPHAPAISHAPVGSLFLSFLVEYLLVCGRGPASPRRVTQPLAQEVIVDGVLVVHRVLQALQQTQIHTSGSNMFSDRCVTRAATNWLHNKRKISVAAVISNMYQ